MSAWQPLTKQPINPALLAADAKVHSASGDTRTPPEAWANDRYQVVVRRSASESDPEEGLVWLSIHRHDRRPIRSWRHLQQIKNEVCGERCEAIELFPDEQRLVDAANETHLWVFPEGYRLPLGFPNGMVSDDEDVDAYNASREAGNHKGRQQAWQEGLTTGRNRHTQYITDEDRGALSSLFAEARSPLGRDGSE